MQQVADSAEGGHETGDKGQGNEPDSERKEWILTVDDYAVFEGIKVPSKIKATWKLDAGEWTWLHLEITDIQYNVSEKL